MEAWIVDDTGFLKQGKHSVGVQRQYTGSAGKITNCQIGVSLSIATRTEHLPIDFELYLPESCANDPVRRQEARIPENVLFKTKAQWAVQMIGRAVADGVPKGVVLADSAYGSSGEFRVQVRSLGLHYAVGVEPQTAISLLDTEGQGGRFQWADREKHGAATPKTQHSNPTTPMGPYHKGDAATGRRNLLAHLEGGEGTWG